MGLQDQMMAQQQQQQAPQGAPPTQQPVPSDPNIPPASAPNLMQANLTKEEETDLKIAVLLGEQLMNKGGYDVIQKALDTSSDPAQVIGQFFVQMIQKMVESFPKEMKISPRIYLCKGGWLEQIMDETIKKLHMDKRISDKAEIYVAHTAVELAKKYQQGQTGQPQQQDAQQQQQAPQGGDPNAMPQGGGQ